MITAENVKKINTTYSKASIEHIKDLMSPVKNIYVDLSLMIDYKLGALLFIFRDNKEVFDYIIDIVNKDYNFLIGKNIFPKFDRIENREEDLIKILEHPNNSIILSTISPITSFQEMFIDFVEDMFSNNKRFNSVNNSRINIYFNNPYFIYPKISQDSLTSLFERSLIKPFFIKDNDYTHPSIKESEFLFINDISLFNSSPIVQELFKQGFVEKTICSSYTSDFDGGDIRDEETKKYFEELENILGQRTDFKFIHRVII